LVATKGIILLINDDIDEKNALAYGLKQHGFDVAAFSDHEQAFAHFEANYYALVLIDVKMPATTGFEVAKRIWALDPDAKICFLSECEIYENEAKVLFKDLKASCFIKKSVRPSELAKQITDCLAIKN
jgi:DNA-binding response OmpR family regulator